MEYAIQRDDDFDKLDHFEDSELQATDVTNPIEQTEQTETVENPFDNTQEDTNEDTQNTSVETAADKIIKNLLSKRGISAIDKVLYEEDGKVIEKNFYELPEEDQLNILSTDDNELSDEELYYITQARENNLGLTELIQHYVNESVKQQIEGSTAEDSIQNYSDEELYVLDLKARLGDTMTDEEILKSLEKELEIPETFKKKVDALRKDYLALEEQDKEANTKEIEAKQEETFNEFKTTISELINNVEDIGGVVLETEDKNEILNFMISKDATGVTEFAKQMRDPENLFLQAWAILKAKDTFDVLKNHFESQLKLAKKASPATTSTKTKDTVVVKPSNNKKITSIEDLNTFD